MCWRHGAHVLLQWSALCLQLLLSCPSLISAKEMAATKPHKIPILQPESLTHVFLFQPQNMWHAFFQDGFSRVFGISELNYFSSLSVSSLTGTIALCTCLNTWSDYLQLFICLCFAWYHLEHLLQGNAKIREWLGKSCSLIWLCAFACKQIIQLVLLLSMAQFVWPIQALRLFVLNQ